MQSTRSCTNEESTFSSNDAVPFWTVEAQREDVKRVLKRLEEDTDRFSKSLDSALDRSVLNGTQAEDEINGYVHQFEEATDRLKDRYEDQGAALVISVSGDIVRKLPHQSVPNEWLEKTAM